MTSRANKRSLPGTLVAASFKPAAFFRDYPELPSSVPSPIVYGIGNAVSYGSLAVYATLANSAPPSAGTLLLLASAGLVVGMCLALPGLYAISAVTHLFVKLVGGRRPFAATKTVIAYASSVHVADCIPIVNLLTGFWNAIIRVVGLSKVHELGVLRATLAVVAPTLATVALALCMRTVVVEAFNVPGASMSPTIELGDHLFVSKSAYGFIGRSVPARGDVIVFEYPEPDRSAPKQDFVKRVVALPGDSVIFDAGHLNINGFRVPFCELGTAQMPADSETTRATLFVEYLDDSVHLIAIDERFTPAQDGPFRVGAGEVFVAGDNRNNSADSRVWQGGRGVGVPLANLHGRAWRIWYPRDRIGLSLQGAPVLPPWASALQPALERCLVNAPSRDARRVPPPK